MTTLQLPVAQTLNRLATFSGVRTWADYWKRVCAPKLKNRKAQLGREVPEREIAAAVEAASGKNSERGLVSLWLLGEREPYISQFFALCEKLEVDPFEILAERGPARPPPMARVNEKGVRRRTAKTRGAMGER